MNSFSIKKLILLLAITGLSGKHMAQKTAEPVAVTVIELFTSQGCSSCPPANELLSKTISDAKKSNKKIVCLSFHVDYWNRLGWKDPFSDKTFSERQQSYAESMHLQSSYTPQMIVNGTREFVGSNATKLEKAISESSTVKARAIFEDAKMTVDPKGVPTISYTLSGNFSDCRVQVALISIRETTSVKRGENSGLTIVNEHVVRQFVSTDASEKGEVKFEASPLPAAGNRAVVLYVQDKKTLKIIGATQLN